MNPIDIHTDLFGFSLSEGDLRKIKTQGKEIIQRVYFAVRDEEWLNIEHVVKDFKSEISATTTTYSYDLLFQKDKVDFTTRLTIKIEDNKLVIEALGKASSDFMKNRIGLCMHLPSSLKGTPCNVSHTDHTSSSAVLPCLVSPHQPIKRISQIELLFDRFSAEIDFEGDIFEMEDQRNWTDASFKIYSTPLELPFPVEVKRGDLFHQKISVTVSSDVHTKEYAGNGDPNTGQQLLPPPLLGMMMPDNLTADIIDHFRENNSFPFSFLRIDFRLYNDRWEEKILNSILFARKMNIPVYAMLYFSKQYNSEMEAFRSFCKHYSLSQLLQFIALLSSEEFVLPENQLRQMTSELRLFSPDVRIGAGTDANFAQLNRNYPSLGELDFVCYSIQPQEHASDRLSITENILGQYDTVKTAQTLGNGKPVHITSLSLFRRFNANVEKITPDNHVPDYPYAGSHFETAWFIGALHELVIAGAETITSVFYPTVNSPLFPFFEKMANHPPEGFYSDCSALPEKYASLSWKSKGEKHLVIANLTGEPIIFLYNSLETKLEPYEIQYNIERERAGQGES